jgi:nicotinamidase-related amidase
MTSDKRHPALLRRSDALLVVVDMQESFLRVISERERLTANVLLLIQAAGVLGVPVLATTQYASRLGGLSPDVLSALPPESQPPVDKMSFSCAGSSGFMARLQTSGRSQIILCGLETHICVAQTALDLAAQGYQVHVAADAVSSRSVEKHKLGMERIRDNGILPCAAEGAVYEMLREAGTPEFKSILALVK